MDKYVEKINGYLHLLELINHDCDRVSDYYIVKLEDGKSLLDSINKYHKSLTESFPPEYWHPNLEIVNFDDVEVTAGRWFFEHEDLDSLHKNTRMSIMNGFYDMLFEIMDNFKVYRLITAPPIWYGSLYDEYIFESSYGNYLLHFSCTD
ncbi:hypothetical protein [Pragia fontium]|uniref:Uncharacterized protein n=1 Tax=Pragia fontium DSM 5563 = ATCC 49100 TaxID=1122977 RepID=A0AAJ5BHL0_9GAMM|nr:hypothetical protein [Pragia fontium]SFC98673.1 hypothetical protein SAMN02745723_106140 [Pragia fontium DSM 5563 = ATCC 49100]SUB82433.1 Uncharacterised protein [Pragia fontium]VEJ55335.1 Uncharacterised protein [Pragia fontium]